MIQLNTALTLSAASLLALLGAACATQSPGAAPATAEEAAPGDPALGFFKLVVVDPDKMQAFYEDVFGFEVVNRYTFPGVDERIMRLPGQSVSLVLFHHTDGREITVGNGHGPVGIATADVDGYYAKALEAGATVLVEPYNLGPTRLGFLLDPEGHQVEVISLGQ